MKFRIIIPLVCALIAGCTKIQSIQISTTRLITISPISETEYCMRITEMTQKQSEACDKWSKKRNAAGATENFSYPELRATVDGGTSTHEIRNPEGDIAASIRLTITETNGSLIADYNLTRLNDDGKSELVSGSIKIK